MCIDPLTSLRLHSGFLRTGPFMQMQKALGEETCPRRSRLKKEGERGGKLARKHSHSGATAVQSVLKLPKLAWDTHRKSTGGVKNATQFFIHKSLYPARLCTVYMLVQERSLYPEKQQLCHTLESNWPAEASWRVVRKRSGKDTQHF